MRGLWKLPDLWTRKRTRAHKVLGRRQTDAGAHSYHRPRVPDLNGNGSNDGLAPAQPRRRYSPPHSGWPAFKRSRLAGFQRSVTLLPSSVRPSNTEITCEASACNGFVRFISLLDIPCASTGTTLAENVYGYYAWWLGGRSR